jgi:hypothetical protein
MDQLNLLIGIILGIFGVTAYIRGFFGWILDNLRKLFSSNPENIIHIPKKTLTLLSKPSPQHTWWHMGSSGDKPAMQIVAKFTATNITKLNILPTQAKMKRPKIFGHVMTRKHDEGVHGGYMIPAGTTTDIAVDFWIMPPVSKEGETFKANISIVDQFGNEHWVKGIEFTYH